MSDLVNEVFAAAQAARQRAHAPYSNYLVGAALKASNSDMIFSGCNVENAAYGATMCAERSGIYNWISNAGAGEIEHLVVVTENGKTPCGFCLQVLSEFCTENSKIYLADLNGVQSEHTLSDFLPAPFTKKSLEA